MFATKTVQYLGYRIQAIAFRKKSGYGAYALIREDVEPTIVRAVVRTEGIVEDPHGATDRAEKKALEVAKALRGSDGAKRPEKGVRERALAPRLAGSRSQLAARKTRQERWRRGAS